MSSSKTIVKNRQVITSGSMTGVAVINGATIDCTSAGLCSFLISWTGTPNGTFTIDIPATIDYLGVPATWATLPVTNASGTALTATGAAGTHQVAVSDLSFTHIRVSYTNSSSTGTLNAWATVKGD